MVEKSVGIRGYIGEHIFEYILEKKYGEDKVIRQISPVGFSQKGGPYLDFGIINSKGELEAIYEIKTQVVCANDKIINKSLIYIWNENPKEFKEQNNKKGYIIAKNFHAYLVLLCPGNDNFMKFFNNTDIKKERKNCVKLFSDYLNEYKINEEIVKKIISKNIERDLPEEIKVILDTKFYTEKGKKWLKDFNNWRK